MKFRLYVSYSQIAVFDPELENPFNEWTTKHNLQGFSWRRGSVSFATPLSANADVELHISTNMEISDSSEIAIVVPFDVPSTEKVEIASIDDSNVININAGQYSLWYECSSIGNGLLQCRFTFVPNGKTEPKVIRIGDILNPTYPLLMDANPA